MAILTVRNLDDSIKAALRIRAAEHGCSMEEEARRLLRAALLPDAEEKGLGSQIHRRVMALAGGSELEIQPRSVPRLPPDFSEGGK